MSRPRKYPEITGYYVYCHITPDEMFYIGNSGLLPCYRWNPSTYKNKSLQPYIEKYGWPNIKHVILKDGLTKEQAEQLEDLLIQEATRQGFCINKNRSGGIARDNSKEYKREYNREYYREYRKTEKYKEYNREYKRNYRLKKKLQNGEEKQI